MTQRTSFKIVKSVCDTCVDEAFNSGFGDLLGRRSVAERVCVEKGNTFAEHECEYHNCQCSCCRASERETWKTDETSTGEKDV